MYILAKGIIGAAIDVTKDFLSRSTMTGATEANKVTKGSFYNIGEATNGCMRVPRELL